MVAVFASAARFGPSIFRCTADLVTGKTEASSRVACFAFDPQGEFVLADKVQIQQVLLNLIRNAIESMEETEHCELVISTSANGGMVEINVADTGAGIAAEIHEQLFQPFVTTKRQGMGVGLSISRTIVEAHGGSIASGPNPGGGTIFSFTLPAVSKDEVSDAV